MKLYSAALSPFAGRARMVIYLKNCPVEIAAPPSPLHTDEFRQINPLDRVPVLDAGGWTLPESQVIAEYLDELYPDPPLTPTDPREKALMRLLCRVCDIYVATPLFNLPPHMSRKTRDEAFVAQRLKMIDSGMVTLDRYIGTSGFAVGKSISLAECAILPVLFFIDSLLPVFDRANEVKKYERLSAWRDKARQIPAAAKVLDEIATALAALNKK